MNDPAPDRSLEKQFVGKDNEYGANRGALPMSQTREERTIRAMVAIYCRRHHRQQADVCSDCAALLDYARARLGKCLFGEDKPVCASCPIHCYRPAMREQIRDVMRYAGPRMLLRHPGLALSHMFHKRKPVPEAKRGAVKPMGKPQCGAGIEWSSLQNDPMCECCQNPTDGSSLEVPEP